MILEFAQGGELFNLLEQENIFDEVWAAFYLAVSKTFSLFIWVTI